MQNAFDLKKMDEKLIIERHYLKAGRGIIENDNTAEDQENPGPGYVRGYERADVVPLK